MAYTTLLVEKKDDGIAVITVNRPDKLNALNAVVVGELDAALAELDLSGPVEQHADEIQRVHQVLQDVLNPSPQPSGR